MPGQAGVLEAALPSAIGGSGPLVETRGALKSRLSVSPLSRRNCRDLFAGLRTGRSDSHEGCCSMCAVATPGQATGQKSGLQHAPDDLAVRWTTTGEQR